MNGYDEARRAAGVISARSTTEPRLLLVLGSGLGALEAVVEERVEIPYRDVPGFPISTAPGHAGTLVLLSLIHI